MTAFLFAVADTPAVSDALALDINSFLSGSAGATLIFILYNVGKMLLDKFVPSRADARANISIVLEGLNSMVKVLQDEKVADAQRLADRQKRIDDLEAASEKDYERLSELRAEIIDLRARLAQKERHINYLIYELQKLGAIVSGVTSDTLEIILPAKKVRDTRKKPAAAAGDAVE